MDQLNDILNKPYARWLEESLRFLNSQDIRSIALIGVDNDGHIMSGYYGCSSHLKQMMASAVQQDAKHTQYQENIKYLNDLLKHFKEDEEESNDD